MKSVRKIRLLEAIALFLFFGAIIVLLLNLGLKKYSRHYVHATPTPLSLPQKTIVVIQTTPLVQPEINVPSTRPTPVAVSPQLIAPPPDTDITPSSPVPVVSEQPAEVQPTPEVIVEPQPVAPIVVVTEMQAPERKIREVVVTNQIPAKDEVPHAAYYSLGSEETSPTESAADVIKERHEQLAAMDAQYHRTNSSDQAARADTPKPQDANYGAATSSPKGASASAQASTPKPSHHYFASFFGAVFSPVRTIIWQPLKETWHDEQLHEKEASGQTQASLNNKNTFSHNNLSQTNSASNSHYSESSHKKK